MFLLMPLLFSLSSHAAPPPCLDQAKFAALTKLAVDKGEVMQGNDQDFHVLKHVRPDDPQKSHRAEYFSAVGITDPEGHFTPSEVSVVSEHWQRQPNGDWVIDQWIWQASLQGEPYSVAHIKLTENKDGSVLGDDSLPTGKPSDPAEQMRFARKIRAEWER